jgi:hypothetical protein
MKRLRSNRGVGPDDVCDLWLQIYDPETLRRSWLVITHHNETPTEWYIRAEDTDGSFPSSYSTVKPSSFHRMVYDAKENGTSRELDMSKTWCRSKNCKVSLLLDLDKGVVYGLSASIQIGDFILSKSMYLDQTAVRAI